MSICSITLVAQEIRISDFRTDTRDISARENPVYDANGDACSLIKARCGIGEGIAFESDLGVRKIDRREGEYWIWVPPGTKKLALTLSDTITHNFELPQLTEEYKVYIFVVIVTLPERIEYRDIPKLSFNSRPVGAKIFLNDIYYGNTPLNVSYDYDTLQIRVEKKTFQTINSEPVSRSLSQEFEFKLKKDPLAKRFFMTMTIDPKYYEVLNPGITFGILGKTGFYLSLRPGFIEPDYSFTNQAEYADTSSYYLSSFIDSKDILRKFEVFGGVTRRVFRNVFISLGIGYWEYKKYQKLTYKPAIQQVQGDKYIIIKIDPPVGVTDFAGVSFDTQLYFRFWNKVILNLQSSFYHHEDFVFESSSWGTWVSQEYDGPLMAEIKIGLGYSF